MKKYTKAYQSLDFGIFQESLTENGLGALADSFPIALGKKKVM